MNRKAIVMLLAVPLLALPPAAFSASPSSFKSAVSLIKTGDAKYIAAVVLSKLPQSVIESVPESFVTYNALRIKKGGNGWGGGHGGGRGHKC
jgi:hypothetical protein